MKFRTEIGVSALSPSIEVDSTLFFIGSCFASTIGEESIRRGLRSYINPFGVTYNPLSIVEVLKTLNKGYIADDSYFREINGKWCSMLHHSDFNRKSLLELKSTIVNGIRESREALKSATHIFITLGTAWVYEDKQYGYVVNNCHKIPEREFNRRLLDVNEVIEALSWIVESEQLAEGSCVYFTISPIRHLRDGLDGNSLSKAILRCAVGALAAKYPDKVGYFPSYEIMMDDLRDYRFYDSDMIHPNGVAKEYIFSVFEELFFSEECKEYGRGMVKLYRAMNHRVIDEDSDEHKRFISQSLESVYRLRERFPNGYFTKLITYFTENS